MKNLWAPWRYVYIRGNKDKECFFCKMLEENKDSENYIIYRGKFNFIVLNKYPYSPGHLMVVPYSHIGQLSDLRDDASLEFINLIDYSIRLLKAAFEPQGFNVGMNIGKVAGAGVEDHIHAHIVPRWIGDSNFITVIGETRVISEALEETYQKLIDAIQNKNIPLKIN